MVCLILALLVVVPGCDLLDRLLGPSPPDCPYPQAICDILDNADLGDLPDRVQCVRDCLATERADE
jgi:hypothetical protein